MIYCRDSKLITSKGNWCLLKVYQIFLQKLKTGNTRLGKNQWDLPDEFIPKGEILSSRTSKIEKYENAKTVKLDRAHQEDLSEISQLWTQTLLIIYSQSTSYLSHTASPVPTSHTIAR